MKKLILAVLCLFLGGLPASAERGVLGAMSYDSPLGCAPDSVFNLVAGSVLNTFSTGGTGNAGHAFHILPDYNNGQGASFQIGPSGGVGTDTTIFTAGLKPLSYFGSVTYSTSNNPDVSNTIGGISLFGSEEVFIHSTKGVTPCNSCLHNWRWGTTSGGPGFNMDLVIGGTFEGQGIFGGISDGTSLYFLHRTAIPASTTNFWKFDVAGTSIQSTVNVGDVNNRAEMVQTASDIYFPGSTLNAIYRINKASPTAPTTFSIPFTILQNAIAYYQKENVFYIATSLSGTTTLRRYNANFSINTHTLSLGTESIVPQGLMMDENAQKLYVVTQLGTAKSIRRINPSTLALEQTLGINLGTTGFVAAPDFTNKFLWISDIGSPSHIQRIQLCT